MTKYKGTEICYCLQGNTAQLESASGTRPAQDKLYGLQAYSNCFFPFFRFFYNYVSVNSAGLSFSSKHNCLLDAQSSGIAKLKGKHRAI